MRTWPWSELAWPDLASTELGWTHVAIALLVVFGLIQTARLGWRARAAGRRLARTKRVAAAGERDAEGILAAAGYRVVDRQLSAKVRYEVDGAPVEVDVRADLRVRRGSETLLAEVKTGDAAPRPTSVPTRRQLLEYAHAFDVDRLLLVDATRGTISEIGLPRRARRGLLARWFG